MRILLALLLMSFATGAKAGPYQWVTIGGDEYGRAAVYLDAGRVERRGSLVEVLIVVVREAPIENGEFLRIGEASFDCRGRYMTDLGTTTFDVESNALKSEGPEPRARVRSGSIEATVLAVACGERPPIAENIESPVTHALSMLTGRADVAAAPSTDSERPMRPSSPEQATTEGGMSSGTGFFIGPNGFLLTSYHVVEGADEIAIRTSSGQVLTATVHRVSQRNDLAVLRVDHRPARYLSFARSGSAHTGDRVFTLGYPVIDILGVGEPRFSDGTVSALSGAGNEDSWMQISVPVQPGNSGGPLLNEAGEVVGVIAAQAAVASFVRETGTLPQNINWAVKAEYASPLIGAVAPGPSRTRSEAIANAREAVVVIVATHRDE